MRFRLRYDHSLSIDAGYDVLAGILAAWGGDPDALELVADEELPDRNGALGRTFRRRYESPDASLVVEVCNASGDPKNGWGYRSSVALDLDDGRRASIEETAWEPSLGTASILLEGVGPDDIDAARDALDERFDRAQGSGSTRMRASQLASNLTAYVEAGHLDRARELLGRVELGELLSTDMRRWERVVAEEIAAVALMIIEPDDDVLETMAFAAPTVAAVWRAVVARGGVGAWSEHDARRMLAVHAPWERGHLADLIEADSDTRDLRLAEICLAGTRGMPEMVGDRGVDDATLDRALYGDREFGAPDRWIVPVEADEELVEVERPTLEALGELFGWSERRLGPQLGPRPLVESPPNPVDASIACRGACTLFEEPEPGVPPRYVRTLATLTAEGLREERHFFFDDGWGATLVVRRPTHGEATLELRPAGASRMVAHLVDRLSARLGRPLEARPPEPSG